VTTQIKLRTHNKTDGNQHLYGSEMWLLNKRYKQNLEAAQVNFFFFWPLLGFIK